MAKERDRLERLYDACAGRALGMLLRLVDDRALAEDLLQDAFVRVSRHVDEVADDRALSTYLYRTGVRLALDARRSGRRAAAAEAELRRRAGAVPPRSASDDVAEKDLVERVRAGLDRLPPRQRAAVMLRIVAGLPFDEVGAALSITDRGAARLVREGLETVRRRLAPSESFRDLAERAAWAPKE